MHISHSNNNNSLGSYYAFHRASAILSHNKDRDIGRVFADYKDKLIIIDGKNRKEHAYSIPKAKVNHYGDKQVYFDISEKSLKEFEI